jgi:hypothetical protein
MQDPGAITRRGGRSERCFQVLRPRWKKSRASENGLSKRLDVWVEREAGEMFGSAFRSKILLEALTTSLDRKARGSSVSETDKNDYLRKRYGDQETDGIGQDDGEDFLRHELLERSFQTVLDLGNRIWEKKEGLISRLYRRKRRERLARGTDNSYAPLLEPR